MTAARTYVSALDQAELNRQEREHAVTVTCMREHRKHWMVLAYRCNHSAFNGYHRTPSAYSALRCGACGRVWRTKAAYVDDVLDSQPVDVLR